jgi:hypothetical protein
MTYTERRAALGWRLVVVAGIGPVVALAVAILLTVASAKASLLIAAAVLYMIFALPLAVRNWPTGIRLDDRGVHIGGSRAKTRVTRQNQGAFECPWRGVTDIRVVTDPKELKWMRTSRELFTLSNHWGKPHDVTKCMLGVLTAPLMRAALVIELYPGDATFPETRPAWFFPNQLGRSFRVELPGCPSSTWIAPTRRPGELKAWLQEMEGPGSGSRRSG